MVGSVINEGEHLFIRYPVLQNITKEILHDCLFEIFGRDYIFDYTKSWGENGLDDLDSVELIMNIERRICHHIPDLACVELVPHLFLSWWRDEKISLIINI